MDGQALEFPDASFDVVILHLIVAVIPDPEACLSEVRRVLKPNGRFTIMDKFIPPNGQVSIVRRFLNPVTNFLFSDITRDANSLLKNAGLAITNDESFKLGIRVILGKKGKIPKRNRTKKPISNPRKSDSFSERASNHNSRSNIQAIPVLPQKSVESPSHQLNLKALSRFPEIETKRLILRRFGIADALGYLELRSNEEAMRYMDRPYFDTKEEAKEAIKKMHQEFRNKEGIWWALADKRNNKFMGYVGFKDINQKDKSAEIGYVLHPDYWASGWMTEAVDAVLDFVFNELNLHRVAGNINPSNEASRGILLKFGFQREAYFREDYYFAGKFLDSEIYGLLASEFESLNY